MLLIGVFQGIAGLAVIIDDDFFVVSARCAFDLDASSWGWIHLVIGLVLGLCRRLDPGRRLSEESAERDRARDGLGEHPLPMGRL
jgi:hypothetical protein